VHYSAVGLGLTVHYSIDGVSALTARSNMATDASSWDHPSVVVVVLVVRYRAIREGG